MLAEIAADFDHFLTVYGLTECKECPGGEQCKRRTREMRAPPLGFSDWPQCPVAEMRSPDFQIIVQLFNAASISPLQGMPLDFVAWVYDGLTKLDRAVTKAAKKDLPKGFEQ